MLLILLFMVHIRALFIISPRATKITGPGLAVVLEWLNHQPAMLWCLNGWITSLLNLPVACSLQFLDGNHQRIAPTGFGHRRPPPPVMAEEHVVPARNKLDLAGHSVRQALGKLRSALTGVFTPTGHSPWDGASLCFQVPPARKGGHGGPGQSNRVYIHFLVKKIFGRFSNLVWSVIPVLTLLKCTVSREIQIIVV